MYFPYSTKLLEKCQDLARLARSSSLSWQKKRQIKISNARSQFRVNYSLKGTITRK